MNTNVQSYWNEYQEKSGKPRTSLNQYRSHFNRITQLIPKDFEKITPEDILEAYDTITKQGGKINMIYVSSVFAWCYSNDVNGCKKHLTNDIIRFLLPKEYKGLL